VQGTSPAGVQGVTPCLSLFPKEVGWLCHYNRTFKAEQYEGLKKKKASRGSSQLCDIL